MRIKAIWGLVVSINRAILWLHSLIILHYWNSLSLLLVILTINNNKMSKNHRKTRSKKKIGLLVWESVESRCILKRKLSLKRWH